MPTPIRCDPKLFEKDLSSQVIVVTGANSGIGFETSRQLAKQGATVVLGCRSKEKGEAAAKEVGGVFVPLDLASLQSIRDFVKAFEEKYDRLDVLVNNAGIMACPFGKTEDGFEMQFGCNHLSHFLLMHLLTPMLLKTAETSGNPSRFVALSSVAAAEMENGMESAKLADIDFDDLNWEKREYSAWAAYGQSKLANYLHALEAGKKYPSQKLISVSVHPGWVLSSLDAHAFNSALGSGFVGNMMASAIRKYYLWKGDMISTVDGAQTTLHCVLADDVQSGKFYSQFGIYKDKACQNGGWPMELPNPNATPEAATRLWEESEKLVGV